MDLIFPGPDFHRNVVSADTFHSSDAYSMSGFHLGQSSIVVNLSQMTFDVALISILLAEITEASILTIFTPAPSRYFFFEAFSAERGSAINSTAKNSKIRAIWRN